MGSSYDDRHSLEVEDRALRTSYRGVKYIIKYRFGWLCVFALSFTGVALGQSLDAGIPSTQIDSSVSSRPQVQDPAGYSVTVSSRPFIQDTVPNAQVNVDVAENPEAIVQSETARSGLSSTAIHLSSSIAGWSAAQQKLDHGIQTPHPSGKLNDRYSLLNSGMPDTVPGGRVGRRATDKAQWRIAGSYRLVPPAMGADEALGDYSSGFPDSTRRATLASPPDPGTESPLAWNPGLNVGFEDIQTSQFLNPSLRVARKRRYQRSLPKRYGLNTVPAAESIFNHDLNSDDERQLQNTLNPPALSPLSSLDQQLNPDNYR